MNSFQIQPQMPPARRLGPPVQPYLPRPDHKKRNLIILICVIAAVMIITGIFWYSYTHSAAYRIRKGFVKLFREAEALKNPMDEKLGSEELGRMFFTEGGEADTKLNVTFDTFLGEITLGVDTDYAKDGRNKKMSASTFFSIMNYELGHMDVFADSENVCFSLPELFLEDLYLENENVLAQYNRSMWAEDWLFGEVHGDDFSIDLFSTPWFYEDKEGVGKAFLNRYAEEIESCRRHMTMEKAGQDLYRVNFDGLYFNEFVRRVLYDYMESSMPGRKDVLGLLSQFDVVSEPDKISLLLEIDRTNKIESIRLENPLSLCKGVIHIDGDVYFLGGENSLEKMQGRIAFDNKEGEGIREHEIVWQVVRSLEQGEYRMESEAKYSFLRDRTKETLKLAWDFSYDGPKNSFKTSADVKMSDREIAMEASGDFSHIVKGESFDLKLDEVNFQLGGEEFLKIKGEVDVSPLSRRVEEIAKPKTALFSMKETDWIRILDKVDREYGDLLDALTEYMW